MEDLTGKQLGSYQIVAPLGEGGMAAVYKAYQANMDRYVALKILPRHFAADPTFVGRFKQEARIIAKLEHAHILPVHDFGETDGYTYITMRFVESGTLADLLQGKPFFPVQTRRIISQIGDALDYAHSQGVIHRDIKPSNILVDQRDNCLLTDFGIAKMVEGTAHFTQTGGAIGTPAYMSPEQIKGEALDGRSDIYSLGIVLYEMVTGRPPYRAETPPAIFVKHLHDPLPPPRTVNSAVSEPVERVILKSLAKQPEDRFKTASDMVQALQAATSAHETAPMVPAETIEDTEPELLNTAEALESETSEVTVASLAQKRGLRRQTWVTAGIAGIIIALVVASLIFSSTRSSQNATVTAQAKTIEAIAVIEATENARGTTVAREAIVQTRTIATTQAKATIESEMTALAMTVEAAAATPSATSTSVIPKNQGILFEDDLSSNANNWWEGEDVADEFGTLVGQVSDGKYRLITTSKRASHRWVRVPNVSAKDFMLNFEASIVESVGNFASGGPAISIVFRADNNNSEYYFILLTNNQYAVRLLQNNQVTTIRGWTINDAIRVDKGITNTLAILVKGSSFTLYINDQELTTVSDEAISTAGEIGFGATLFEANQTVTIHYDNFVIEVVR